MKEETLRNKVIRDLKSNRINTINLKSGTFDLMVEGRSPFFLELKILKKGGLSGFEDHREGLRKGFAFTEDQTREIFKMKFPVFVLAKDEKDYYFFNNDWVKWNVKDLEGFPRAIIYEFRWNDKEYDVIPPISYDEAISTISKLVRRKKL